MRRKLDPQQNLLYLMARNKVARELEAISLVLDQNPGIPDLVFRDLVKYQRMDNGRGGMTAEQALRSAILKQYRELTYEELAFHLEDSTASRSFTRLDMGQYPCGSTLQDNIKAIAAETWEAVNLVLLEYAGRQKVEQGRAVRLDATVVETWRKGEPEHFKTAGELLTIDKGGLTFMPPPGLHTRVAEVDFAYMYPTIMTIHNISPETVNCHCCTELVRSEGRAQRPGSRMSSLRDGFVGAQRMGERESAGRDAGVTPPPPRPPLTPTPLWWPLRRWGAPSGHAVAGAVLLPTSSGLARCRICPSP